MGLMDRDLSSYVLVLEDWIDAEACKQTVQEIQNAPWQQHTFYNVNTDSYHSTEKELSVFFNHVETKPALMQLTHNLLTQYMKDLNFPWFSGWAGFTDIRFNRYAEQTNIHLS